jgi:hypothetical protein
MKALKTLLVCASAAALFGCATPGDQNDPRRGMLSETAGLRIPEGLTRAVIYEIDGERVFYGRGTHPVEPGVHYVRVWPEQAGPRSGTPIPGAHAGAERINAEILEITVQPGAHYYIGAMVRRHRVYAGGGESAEALGPWQTTILPVVVRDTET